MHFVNTWLLLKSELSKSNSSSFRVIRPISDDQVDMFLHQKRYKIIQKHSGIQKWLIQSLNMLLP